MWGGLYIELDVEMFYMNPVLISTGWFVKEKVFESCDFIILNPSSCTASVINWFPDVKIS